MSSVDIEKESLEAHVELCSERYSRMEEKFSRVEKRISILENMLGELKDLVVVENNQRNKQIINWSLGLVGFLSTVCVTLVYIMVQ